MSLKEKVKDLPSSPGVYLMKDSFDDIIYVGKSKELRKRVQSYFQNSKVHSPKVKKLVQNLKDFQYIVTDTEFEAFMLECELIKEIKPRYNKLMKSPQSYKYIEISIDEDYPRIEIVNSKEENENKLYFGPYTNKSTVERAISGIKEHCKINCSNTSKKGTPCLNYSLNLCIGICIGEPSVEDYHSVINEIIALLNGTDKGILEKMEKNMMGYSEDFNFEAAAKYRDYISAANYLISKEKIIDFAEENKNIVMIEYLSEDTFKLFLIKRNKVIFSYIYRIDNSNIEDVRALIKINILTCFSTKTFNFSTEITRDEIDEAQIIYSYLKSNNCRYTIIPESWLNSENHVNIDMELNKLLN